MTLSVRFVSSTETRVDTLLSDFQWAVDDSSATIAYSFVAAPADLYLDSRYGYSAADSVWNFPFRDGFRALSTTEQVVVRAVFDLYESIVAVTFVEVSDASQADIHFAVTDLSFEAVAGLSFAPAAEFLPFSVDVNERHEPAGVSGDIWLDDGLTQAELSQTLLPEIGQALGLSRPDIAGLDRVGSGAVQQLADTLNYTRYTLLSEHAVPVSVAAAAADTSVASTPMFLDIQALQSLYGAADNETDDLYIINAARYEHLNPESLFFEDHEVHSYTNSYLSIVDNGGHNVLVVLIENDLEINLTANSWSNTGGGYATADAADANLYLSPDTIIHELITGAGNDRVVGNDLGNTIFVDGGDDVVITGVADDLVSLGKGDDRVVYSGGNDRYSGGPGRDVVVFSDEAYSHFKFTTGGGGVVVVAELSGTDLLALAGFEVLKFGDSSFRVDHLAEDIKSANRGLILQDDKPLFLSDLGTEDSIISAMDAQLYRIYYGSLGRTPDQAGFAFWQEQLASGVLSLAELASRFVHSPEFQLLADADGRNGVDDTEFLDHIYANVFGRKPDVEGYNWWLDQLETNDHTQASAFAEMTQSDEFVLLTAATISDFIFV